MGLLTRIFGNGREREPGGPPSSQFHESDSTSNEGEASRNAPRRELVQVIMRDTMRKHGIPTDWMECRILSTVNRSGRAGLHANFVIKQAHQQMLSYVFAFQDSFETELARFEPRARDWLMGLSWEFQGLPTGLAAQAALPRSIANPAGTGAPFSLPPLSMNVPQDRAFAPTDDAMAAEMPRSDEEVQRDLKALFAIRDAAMAQAARRQDADGPPDFENTRPFDDDESPGKKG
ncbi:hypothetical protein HHL11_16705 [Ramlibacter sp. G-1-2-2]|uniref:Uncharacterized protein n=1 Tax=Ramlibacter agri TaxID=2728837 RepID=A0A848H355_9BURK|nr:hypothetical protein [Ramlibacter agri]NML45396.1 hypothetical protein [Ramlibacter agri]